MKKSYLFTCIGAVMSLLVFLPAAHAQTYPYTCGFEDDAENAQWTLVNGDLTNQWHIGTADKQSGEKGLYISSDGGATSGYNPDAPSTVFAYRTIEITEGASYSISFDCNVLGEGSDWGMYDYAEVLLAPGDAEFTASNNPYQIFLPENCISLTGESYLVNQYSWENRSSLQELTPGTYKLVFMWHNDDMTGEGSAAIDNVRIEKLANSPSITVSSSLEFPLTAVGASSIATLTIQNTGGGDLYISSFDFSDPAFTMATPIAFPDTIKGSGGEKSYQIKFSPSSADVISGTLSVKSNTDDQTVSLTGTGYSSIEITDQTPLFEDFEGLDSSLPNLGLAPWTLKEGYTTSGSPTSWSICTTEAYTCGGKSLQANDVRATATALLISPKLTFAADRSGKISFYMRRSGGTSKPNEGFKVYVNTAADIYNYDSEGNIVINDDNSVTTLVEPILHATKCGGSEIKLDAMYKMEVNIPAEYNGKEFFVIFEAIQEYLSYNTIDDIRIELLPNAPLLGNTTETLDFGFVKVGETASREFSLANIGTNVLSVAFSQAQENSPFTITPEHGEINFNEQQTFTVNFSASEVSQFNDSIFITTNGGNDTIALRAETYPTTSYYETFDASTNLPAEWVIAQNGGETTYSIMKNAGADESNVLTAKLDYYGSESEIDTIYSPVVSGKVTFDFKKLYSSSSIFNAYIVDAAGNSSEIDLGANSTNWTSITVDDVPEGSRIAFLISNSYLDNFMAFTHHEVSKGVQLLKSSLNRPSSFFTLYAGTEKAAENTLQFTFKNIGTQTIEAGSYNFTIELVGEDNAPAEGVSYKTYIVEGEEETLYEDNVIPGPELEANAEKTIKGYLLITCDDEYNKMSFNVKVNDVDNTHFTRIQTGNSISIKPNKGNASLQALDFGLTNKTATVDYIVRNSSANGALTISAITAPEGSVFTVNAELPMVIPSSKSDTIQITFAAEPGYYSDSIDVEHDGIGQTKIPVSGTMMSPTALLESFEGDIFPPILWETTQGKWAQTTTTKYHGNASATITESVADTLITPLLHLAAGDSIAFTAKATGSSGYGTDLLYSADGQTWNLLESYSVYASYWNDWEQLVAYMPEEFVEGDYYIGFASKKTFIDLVYGPQVVYQEHRIDIKGFTGSETGMVNYTQDFTINIACLGTEGETADSYSIALMNGDENIGNYTVEPMVLGDMKSYTCSWTPHTVGEAQIYALLTTNGTVTSTDTITVNVAEETLISNVVIGDFTELTSASGWKHYFFETLYTPDLLEGLSAGDVIESVRFPYVNTAETTKNYRVNIWIGNTTKSELNADKVGEADIAGLSHIGSDLRFEVGGSLEEPLYFELAPETPITYDGGNLSIIVSIDSLSYAYGVSLITSPGNSNSMRYYNFDGYLTTPDYMEAWTNGSYSMRFADKILNAELGLATEAPTVYGVVTRSDNDEPIEGATVTMKSGEIIYSTTTDASGAYSIDVLQPGKEYEMSVTKDSYTGVEGVIVAVDKDDVEQNFELTVISGIDHTAEAATKIFTDRAGNIHIKAGASIDLVKVYSISGSLCITESPATDSAVINAANMKGVYIVEVQTAGNVKRAKVRL